MQGFQVSWEVDCSGGIKQRFIQLLRPYIGSRGIILPNKQPWKFYSEVMTQESQAVLAANQAFYRAFEKKDIEAMSAVWSRGTGSLCIHPGRSVLRGWEATRSSWEQIFKNTSYLEIDLDIISTEVSGNLAYVVLVENLLQVAGGRQVKAQSMATNIFERMGQKWYLVHHHGSPVAR